MSQNALDADKTDIRINVEDSRKRPKGLPSPDPDLEDRARETPTEGGPCINKRQDMLSM